MLNTEPRAVNAILGAAGLEPHFNNNSLEMFLYQRRPQRTKWSGGPGPGGMGTCINGDSKEQDVVGVTGDMGIVLLLRYSYSLSL